MKQFVIAIIMICFANITGAQPAIKKAERIQALKIAFITQRLDLSSDEAQRFWPVYRGYENELKQQMMLNRGGDVIDNEERMLNIRKHYRQEFVRVIGPAKTNRLFTAEKDFRTVLLRKLRNSPNPQRQITTAE